MRLIDADMIPWEMQLEPMGDGNYEVVMLAHKDEVDMIPPAESTGALDDAIQHYLAEDLMGIPEDWWIPSSERLPEDENPVLISEYGLINIAWYDGNQFECGVRLPFPRRVDAWMPLPKPYKGGGEKDG